MDSDPAYACIITPLGEGGIGIVALWGPGAARVLDILFVGTRRRGSSLPVGTIAHGTIRRQGEVMDEVIVARPGAPHEGLSEPYFEINCHGGVVAVRCVFECAVAAGARAVAPAAVNARPDGPPLSPRAVRAYALAALAHVPTRLGARVLLQQANGALTEELHRVCELLGSGDAAAADSSVRRLLETAKLGRALLRPPRVALLGPPNAGKSTLFNALCRAERVIVDPEPGTTRDVIAETVSVGGVPFEIMDSAGIGESADELEQKAAGRARALAWHCQVVLAVFDCRVGLQAGWLPAIPHDARLVLVANKVDLVGPAGCEPVPCPQHAQSAIRVSALTGRNIERVEDALLEPYERLLDDAAQGSPVVFSPGQERALTVTREVLARHGSAAALASLQEARGNGSTR
jgi:tRNA modification GTPase